MPGMLVAAARFGVDDHSYPVGYVAVMCHACKGQLGISMLICDTVPHTFALVTWCGMGAAA